ncbi:MAG: redoxin domain-containing protein [bacterium]
MRHLPRIMILVGLILAATVAAEDEYTMYNFMQAYRAANSGDEVVALCENYMTHVDDIELLRDVQGRWLRYDQIGAEAFAKKQAAAHPESMQWAYLYGRTLEDPTAAITIGRQMVATDPGYAYGYRLLLGNYTQGLFGPYGEEKYVDQLAAMLLEDAVHFAKAVEIAPGETWPLEFLYGYQVYSGDYDQAMTTLQKGMAMDKGWPSQEDYATLYARLGRFGEAKLAIATHVDALIEDGWAAEERGSYISQFYGSALRDAKAYDEVIEFEKSVAGYEENADALYNIACSYSLLGNADEAFAFLAKATEAGFAQVGHLKEDSDLEPLHADPRWEKAVAVAQAKWDSGKDERREKALAEKLNRPAPEFSLPGVDGKLVALADLRGKVVILDFWATWCGPCRMAMPAINQFVQSKPEDVLVFSIDVWERGGEGPTKFMTDNSYGMTLLFGNNQTARDYGVTGIPYLCVIDQEGVIQYEHPGYSEELGEDLVWWTEDLLSVK